MVHCIYHQIVTSWMRGFLFYGLFVVQTFYYIQLLYWPYTLCLLTDSSVPRTTTSKYATNRQAEQF